MSVEEVLRILYPGVKGFLSPKQAANLVLSLVILATDPIDSNTLRFYVRFFTPADYDDLIEEHCVVHRCGYPLCKNRLLDSKGNLRKQKITHSAINQWATDYCSRHCYQSSVFFRKQLSAESLVTRRDVAYTPFGEMAYENGVLLLHQVEQIAKADGISVSQVVGDQLRKMSQLESSIEALDLSQFDHLDLGDQLASVTISEKPSDPAKAVPPPAESAQ